MSQMPRQLELEDVVVMGKHSPAAAQRNVELWRQVYRKMHNDENSKEWQYHSVNGKRWRHGPDPAGEDYLHQYLTSGDWRVQDNWDSQFGVLSDGGIILPKASGKGIKVDLASPTFGWRDLKGDLVTRNTGASKPTLAVFKGGCQDYQFAAGKEEYFKYHIPHDHVPGTDLHLHFHWSHIGTLVTGGTVVFDYEATYAKGFDQSPFGTNAVGTITGTASTVQYQKIISEGQFSPSSPSAAQKDTDNLEPDGVRLVTAGVNANNLTVSGGGVPDPFIHYVDIHYQSTNMATKQKAPDFYT